MMDIGDRMKQNYEHRQRYMLTRRMPVIIRVDGKAFHTLTRSMNKPFDNTFICAMLRAAHLTSHEMQGYKAVYVQSDEASFLLTDYDMLNTDAWFGYNKSKLESVSAALMSVNFNHQCQERGMDFGSTLAVFDARAFNIPREEVTNYFLWRLRDWERNSLQMYCQAYFSHKDLLNKNHAEMHEMLYSIGKNWVDDLPGEHRNGVFICGNVHNNVSPSWDLVNEQLDPLVNVDKLDAYKL